MGTFFETQCSAIFILMFSSIYSLQSLLHKRSSNVADLTRACLAEELLCKDQKSSTRLSTFSTVTQEHGQCFSGLCCMLF